MLSKINPNTVDSSLCPLHGEKLWPKETLTRDADMFNARTTSCYLGQFLGQRLGSPKEPSMAILGELCLDVSTL